MARILGVPESKASLFARFAYRASRKLFGKVAESLSVKARHRDILFGAAMMERAEAKARLVSHKLKALGEIRAATIVGCPF
jgi:hypothetical protein